MQKPRIMPFFAASSLGALGLALGACATDAAKPGETDLEIRHTGAIVSGSQFTCTGTWPSTLTPCGYSWSSQPATAAIATSVPDSLELVLNRHPIPVDGGASM